MIKINRSSVAIPASLAGTDNSTCRQRKKAKDYYAAVPPPKTTFAFDKYKEPDIVSALESLFHKKCAYCESRYAAVSKMDVEHYRPKGGVNECPSHIGYWWLALEWNNLLPSCIDCNRRRGQLKAIRNPDGSIDVIAETENSGKENAFPIAGTKFAMKESDDYSIEEPLIINPCETDPKNHLDWFISNTNIPVVIAKEHHGLSDLKGQTTIKILGLNRWDLVNERAENLQQLAVIVADINDFIEEAIEMDPGEKRDKKIKKINNKIAYLLSFGNPEKKYSAMSKSYIDKQLLSIYIELEKLKDTTAHGVP